MFLLLEIMILFSKGHRSCFVWCWENRVMRLSEDGLGEILKKGSVIYNDMTYHGNRSLSHPPTFSKKHFSKGIDSQGQFMIVRFRRF
jgi:hypothetical protein